MEGITKVIHKLFLSLLIKRIIQISILVYREVQSLKYVRVILGLLILL